MSWTEMKGRAATWTAKPGFVGLALFLFAILAYGLLIPWLHLYIDDWIWVWTWERMGRAGLVKYFSTNRPLWGLIFQITIPLLGKNILAFHLFALVVRWGCSMACWWLLRLIWPERKLAAFTGALIFLLYPGFVLQPIALTYGHLFLVFIFFLLSLCFNLLALRQPRRYFLYTSIAILLSTVNLLTMEYFVTLELVRPLLIWLVPVEEKPATQSNRLKWTAKHWLPYLLLFAGIGLWRTFIFKVITARYHLTLLDQLRQQPFGTLLALGKTVLASIWNTTAGAWLPAASRMAHLNPRLGNSLVTILLAAATACLLIILYLIAAQRQETASKPLRRSLGAIALGLVLLLLAGWPFWLTGLKIQPLLDKSRFTIPFILGTAVLLVGLLDLIRPKLARAIILAALVGMASGYHFQIANEYRLDWEQNRLLMWQIAWRIPRMEEGTTLLITDFPVTHYDTPTLATELNMIYPVEKRFPDLAYDILYDREQDELLQPEGLRKGVPLEDHNVTSPFHGSTSQVLSAQYNLSRCFRLLDPTFDSQDATLPVFTRRAVQISDWAWVRTDLPASVPPETWFGKEPQNTWCYFFEKAELARQEGDWDTAARLGDQASAKGLTPRDEMEKLVFIEANARTGNWQKAVDLSRGFSNPEKQPMLCLLWKRIDANTSGSAGKSAALDALKQANLCP